MWTVTDAINWLVSLGIKTPLVPGTQLVPPLPDILGVVTPTSGAAQQMEELVDVPGFQLRIRGQQNDPVNAEQVALDADARIRNCGFPVTVPTLTGSVRLLWVRRAGGRPSPMGPSPDAGDRATFTCTYLLGIMEVTG